MALLVVVVAGTLAFWLESVPPAQVSPPVSRSQPQLGQGLSK